MSKFMALSMSFEKVVEKTTIAATHSIDQTDIGHLGVGALCDLSILHEERRSFEFLVAIGERIVSDKKQICGRLLVGCAYL
jgi:predicted amidohydrolase